ncbi:hypothetical protein [Candidatus Villigracilis saccharophilus]|uniref:hypothetical protein n=1 Tax=Candidatus Villigracilis saccharophilus TaxID=3140684 RepID=UPI003135C570|nr:hypothetical protein [Anaerolineales bacterium]
MSDDKKVENVLIQSKQFHLLGKKALQPSDAILEIVLVDATEQPIERPKKDKSAKKKASHPKAQLIADLNTELILATDFCNGKQHDFSCSSKVTILWQSTFVFWRMQAIREYQLTLE